MNCNRPRLHHLKSSNVHDGHRINQIWSLMDQSGQTVKPLNNDKIFKKLEYLKK